MTNQGTPAAGANTSEQPNPEAKNQGPDKDAELRQKTAALAEERDRTRQLKEELEILKASSGHHAINNSSNYSAPQDANDTQRQLDELWETSPKQAIRTELTMAFDWYDRSVAQMDIQADEVSKKFSDFNNYRSDVNRYVRSLPIASRNRPGVMEAAYFYVKGQRADDLVTLSKDELIAKIRAGERVQGLDGAISGGSPKPNISAPTNEQINAANAMRIPIEDYMKHVR